MTIDWEPLRDIIESNQRFVLSSHVRPDADALGSELGMAAILESMGKTVVLVTHDVEEALLLSTRIVLLSNSPGRVVDSLEINLPHRVRAQSTELLRLKTQIYRSLGHDEENIFQSA